jgi:hypothetical protein
MSSEELVYVLRLEATRDELIKELELAAEALEHASCEVWAPLTTALMRRAALARVAVTKARVTR